MCGNTYSCSRIQSWAERLNERGERWGWKEWELQGSLRSLVFHCGFWKWFSFSFWQVYQIFKRCPSHCWTSSTSVGWLHTSQQHAWMRQTFSLWRTLKIQQIFGQSPDFLHWKLFTTVLKNQWLKKLRAGECPKISWLLPLHVLNTRS